jgi:glucosamine-6-phosphate deaminase
LYEHAPVREIATYLAVPGERLGEGTPVRVRMLGDPMSLARDMAEQMLGEIRAGIARGRAATLIVPVGPVDQFPILATMVNEQRVDCRDVCLINMDEYLTDDDRWIPADHPLSFRGFMGRLFYDRVERDMAPRPENRVFPDPSDCDAIGQLIERRGGVDVCFGGIGINGHIAFNEPPGEDEVTSDDAFVDLPTRVVSLACETRTINGVTVGGELSVIPRRAVTVGMRECLGARKLRFYCNRPWQSAVVRRVLHGPITAACPASFLRTHPDAQIAIAEPVAQKPDIRLR